MFSIRIGKTSSMDRYCLHDSPYSISKAAREASGF
jgi:hypothetical protein